MPRRSYISECHPRPCADWNSPWRRTASSAALPKPWRARRCATTSCGSSPATSRRDNASRTPLLHPILDNVKDPILTVGPDGIVQEANAAAARLLDAPVADIVGYDVARFIPQLVPARPTLDALADRVADTFVDASPELHRGGTQRRPAVNGRGHRQPRRSRPEHVLRAVHARRHRAAAGRAGAARERSAVSRARRERARGHRRARRRPQRLRRCQRQCRQAVQVAARGAARQRARGAVPGVSERRASLGRFASQLCGPRAARRAARVRVAASRWSGQGHAVRSAVHSPAVVEATADPRQHPRQRGAPPSRHARLRRAARARAGGRERAAREDAARRRAAHRAAASGRQRGHHVARCRCRRAQSRRGQRSVGPRHGAVGETSGRLALRLVRRRGVAGPAGRRPRRRERSAVGRARERRRCERRSRLLLDTDHHGRRPRPRHARVVLRCRARPEHRGARPRHSADAARGHRHPPQAGRDCVCATARRASGRCSTTSSTASTRRRRAASSCRPTRRSCRCSASRMAPRSAAATWRSSSWIRRSARASSASSRATAGCAISSISCARVRAASSSSSRTRGS